MSADIIRCARCISPESLPSVQLDENAVCNHCRDYERLFGDWHNLKRHNMRRFEEQRERARRLARPYDCLIPLSGGKDSTYALYLCSKVYGLRCLCVTFDNGFLSEYARRNIQNALEATGADHMYYRIDRDTLMDLYGLFLRKCGSFCVVCLRGIQLSTEMAVRAFKVPLVVHGGGARTDYLTFVPELFQGGDVIYFRNVLRGEELAARAGPLACRFVSFRERLMNTLYQYRIVRVPLRLAGIPPWSIPLTVPYISLFDYIDDISHDEIYATIRQEMGWDKPSGQLQHIDCKVHDVYTYIHTLKFPQVTAHTFVRSSLIRLGRIAREEALLAEMSDLAAPKEPQVLDYFLDQVGVSKEEFVSSAQDWRTLERFRPEGGNRR